MDPMAIIGIAAGVGALVYALSLRTATEQALPVAGEDEGSGPISEPRRGRRRSRARGAGDPLGFSSGAGAQEADAGSPIYLPVLASPGPGWRDRLVGLVGLVASVIVAAALLAAAVYQAGHIANRMIEEFLGR